jgi:hypothetical protein
MRTDVSEIIISIIRAKKNGELGAKLAKYPATEARCEETLSIRERKN